MNPDSKITGVVLAGGQARRMANRDKGLVLFKNRPLVEYTIAAMQPLVDELFINANRNLDAYQKFGWPVITDLSNNFDGPLAGIMTAMEHANSPLVLIAPCDSPLIKPSHLERLLTARAEQDAEITVAFANNRLQPVFLAVKTELKEHLSAYLAQGNRKMFDWLNQHRFVSVDFGDAQELFININTMDELAALESHY